MQYEPACRTGRIDAFAERNEADTDGVEFVEQQDQMPQIAPEAIETPAH